jgi:hypothetical protein
MVDRIGRRIGAGLACALWLALSVPQTAIAQDEEPAPVVYGVYFQCEPAAAARASEIILDSWGPIVQAHIDAGQLLAWGSLTHHTGGPWSRAVYIVGADAQTAVSQMDAMGTEWNEADPDAVAEFWEACDEHEDYLWTRQFSSAPAEALATQRPGAGMSTYWVCDESREGVADLIAEHVWAEAWNAQVESGLIHSWAWLSHFIGDKYRRLLAVDGANHADLLTARDNAIEWVAANEPGLAGEFSNVCNGHVDYLWNIEASYP